MMQLANRTSLITESNTSKMRNKANQLKEKNIPVINFAAGELDFNTSENIRLSVSNALDKGYNKYTDTLGIMRLREYIANQVTEETGVTYGVDEIGITSGAKQALFNAAFCLFEEGDEVIIPSPFWGTFSAQIALTGAKTIILDTSKTNYQIDISELKKLITPKTKGIVINTPNNPTGVVYDELALTVIAQLAIEHNFYIIFDECYSKLVYQPAKHTNIVKCVNAVKDRTIIINSFSKTYAVTGWRIGYFAADKKIVKAIKDLQGHSTSNPSCLSQYGLLSAFEADHSEFLNHINAVLTEGLNTAIEIMDSIPGITYQKPQGAFYLYPNIEKLIGKTYAGKKINTSTDLAEILLEESHVAVVPGDAFSDPFGIRISYAISKEDVIEGLNRIKNLFTKIFS